MIIFLILALLFSFLFFFRHTRYTQEQISQMDFSLLSERVVDYSADPILLSFQPISLDVIIDILRDKQPGAPNLEQRIEKILEELKDEEEEEAEAPEPESEEIPPPESYMEEYPINNNGSSSRGFCGDGNRDPAEQCDPPNGTTCDTSCQNIPIVCGNSIVQPGEECDDSNTTGGDGCSAICMLEVCGNNVLDIGEECDDGNTINGDGCSAICTLEGPVLCTEVSFLSFSHNGKWIRWELFNDTGLDIVIEEINIDWPVEMECLNRIDVNGDRIWNGSDTSPPTLINSGWTGDATDRTIEIGNTEILGFKFDNNNASFGYEVTVTFPDPSLNCYINNAH